MVLFFQFKYRVIDEKLLRALLFLVVAATIIVNFMYLWQTQENPAEPKNDRLLMFGDKALGVSSNSDDALKILLGNSDVMTEKNDKNWISITARAGTRYASVIVNGKEIFKSRSEGRGLQIVVLSEITGDVTAARLYDTYFSEHRKEIVDFLASLPSGRIVIFMTVDEASFSLSAEDREMIGLHGSEHVWDLDFRDAWTFIAKINQGRLAENLLKKQEDEEWPGNITTTVNLKLVAEHRKCDYGSDFKRREFCDKYDGYGRICKCTDYEEISFKPNPLPRKNYVADIPIVIIAANRPYLLYMLLRKLLNAPGIDKRMITVSIDNEKNDEIFSLCRLYGLNFVVHKPVCAKNCRISQHYRRTFTETFHQYPKAEAMIILEEDLDVSEDIIDYFSQTYPILMSEESLFCVSAWNDQGYNHTVHDPALLLRVSSMPGLGWILKRSIYKGELEAIWPSPRDYVDWDVWLRQDTILKGRDCIIPEISRTFHRGTTGVNMNEFFHDMYFKNHALNTLTGFEFDVDKVRKDVYVKEMHQLVRNAIVLNHAKNPCSHPDDFMPKTKGKTYVTYIRMETAKEDERNIMTQLHKPKMHETWINYARCMKIWDLSPRGLHNKAIRIWYKDNYLIIVGVPTSPYSMHKPNYIRPVFIPKVEKNESQ